jgi:hypothetical protein
MVKAVPELLALTAHELTLWAGILGLACLGPVLARNWRQRDVEVRPAGISIVSPDDRRALELAAASWQLDLNAATEAELLLLPGLGQRRAHDILLARGQKGAFHSVWELAEIPGITKALVARLENLLRVGGIKP